MSDHAVRRGWGVRLAVAAGILLGVPLLLLGVLLVALNTGPGQRLAERLTTRATGGMVTLAGLHGRLPDAPRLASLELRDAGGVWLSAHGIALDWSPLALLGRKARIRSLSAHDLQIRRLPQSRTPAPARPAPPFRLPLAVDAGHVAIADLALGAALAGAPAHLAASGSARLTALDRGTIDLALARTDRPGAYRLHAAMGEATVVGRLAAHEPAHGLVANAAHLPDLGALDLEASLAGPWTAAALKLALAAGALHADSTGTLDLRRNAADLALTITAPAMAPAPGLSWHSVAIAAHLTGPFARPAADGTLAIADLEAGGAHIGRIDGHLTADTRFATLAATAAGLHLAPPNQTLLDAGPLTLQARIALEDPSRPISYAFAHPLLTGQGKAVLAPLLQAGLTVSLPDLTVLAHASGRDVAGIAGFTLALAQTAARAMRIDLDAAMEVTGGADAPAAARGRTTLGATVTLAGADIMLSRLALAGTTLTLHGTGQRRAGQVTAQWQLAARDLHELVPALRGQAAMTGQLTGRMAGTTQDFTADAAVTGSIGSAAIPPGPVSLAIHGTGLPDHPAGHLQASATLQGAPLALAIDAGRTADQALHLAINQASWKSTRVTGALTLAPGRSLPTGQLDLAMPRLDDFRALLGRPLTGSLAATLDLPPSGQGRIDLTAHDAGLPGTAQLSRAVLSARLSDPADHPTIAATLTATGLKAGPISGDLRLAANGRQDALGLTLTATLRQLAGADAVLAAAATLDLPKSLLRLASLTADWHAEHLALAAPAMIAYAPGLAVDRLRLLAVTQGADPATLDLAGTITPRLALTLAARDLTPALARPFSPTLDADGTLRLDATLGGSLAAPTGTLRLAARNLRQRSGPARGLPPAALTATATLAGAAAQLDAALTAGSTTHLALRGAVPLRAGGALSLRAEGAAELAMLDPILMAQGRRLRGAASLQATIGGTAKAPAIAGQFTLAHAEVQDFAQGLHVTDIDASVIAEGSTLRIARFTGTAGGGTLGASGTVGLAGTMPVALHLTALNARPVNSDLVTATLDADLAITGQARSAVRASGRIHIRRADIQVPDKLPATVAVLTVRRPGDRLAAPASGPSLQIPLDLTLDAPQQIFVRGRGLDAELGGTLHVGGTTTAPTTSGTIDLRTGSYSLAGTTLTFTSGNISFNGATRIDPALDLVATSSTPDLTATLTVGGYASGPKITLSSVPDRPQDEVLAALLFRQSATSLSPFQLAQIASALAQVSGVGGGGPDPIARLRKGLGLDRLGVASSQTGTNGTTTTSVEAGRYVAPGVFVGAKQGLTGAQTAAEVQIDLTRRLKLNTTVGSGTGSNTLGLTYQFQY